MQTELTVQGMTCGHCEAAVPGVITVLEVGRTQKSCCGRR